MRLVPPAAAATTTRVVDKASISEQQRARRCAGARAHTHPRRLCATHDSRLANGGGTRTSIVHAPRARVRAVATDVATFRVVSCVIWGFLMYSTRSGTCMGVSCVEYAFGRAMGTPRARRGVDLFVRRTENHHGTRGAPVDSTQDDDACARVCVRARVTDDAFSRVCVSFVRRVAFAPRP